MRSLTWEEATIKEVRLKQQQKENLPRMIEAFDKLGFDVIETEEISDGWMTGFTIYQFTCKDRRSCKRDADQTFKFEGNADNTAIFKVHESGGKGLFKNLNNVR